MRFILANIAWLFLAAQAWCIDRKQVCQLVGAQASIVALDASTSQTIVACQPDLSLKPASVLKIITTAAALYNLGPEYRFSTEAYVRGRKGATVEHLLVRGMGDPALTSEELWKFARSVRAYGIRSIGKIYLDGSSFVEQRTASGQRAYQSGASALAFSFNSVAAKVCPAMTVGEPAWISVDPYEADAKLEGAVKTSAKEGSVALELLNSTPKLRLRVSGTIGRNEECYISYRSVADFEQYFGSVLTELLRKEGVEVRSGFEEHVGNEQFDFLFTQRSKPLRQILDDLNHFSTNFIAQQIVYALGEQADGRFSFKAGLQRIQTFLESQQLNQDNLKMVDGAGLSHENRLSAMQLAQVIKMLDKSSFSAEFRSSLPISGLSGTLKHRDFELPSASVRAKTGTLDLVSSLAGIMRTANGRELYFVILHNATGKDQATRIEDKLVRMLYAD